MRGPFLLEIANPHSNTAEDVRRWTAVLRRRTRQEAVGAVAVDDAHTPRQIGRAWIMVKVPGVSADHLRAALRSFAFYATTGPEVELGASEGAIRCAGEVASLTFVDQEGRVRAEVPGPDGAYRPAGDEGFIRVEARNQGGGRVWSQPFWIDDAERNGL